MSKKPKQKSQPPSLEQAATAGRQASPPPPEIQPDPNFKTEYLNEHGQDPVQLADQLSRRDSSNTQPPQKVMMDPNPNPVFSPPPTALPETNQIGDLPKISSMLPDNPEPQSTPQAATLVVSTDLPSINENSTPASRATNPELLLDLDDDDAEEIVHVDPELKILLDYMRTSHFLADEMDNVLGSLMQMPFGIPVFDQWDIEATPTQILQDVENMCKSPGFICEKWPAIKILLSHEKKDEHWACRLLIIFAFMELVMSL